MSVATMRLIVPPNHGEVAERARTRGHKPECQALWGACSYEIMSIKKEGKSICPATLNE